MGQRWLRYDNNDDNPAHVVKVTPVHPEECAHHGDLLKLNRQMVEASDKPMATAIAFFDASLHGVIMAYGDQAPAMIADAAERVRFFLAQPGSET